MEEMEEREKREERGGRERVNARRSCNMTTRRYKM